MYNLIMILYAMRMHMCIDVAKSPKKQREAHKKTTTKFECNIVQLVGAQ